MKSQQAEGSECLPLFHSQKTPADPGILHAALGQPTEGFGPAGASPGKSWAETFGVVQAGHEKSPERPYYHLPVPKEVAARNLE